MSTPSTSNNRIVALFFVLAAVVASAVVLTVILKRRVIAEASPLTASVSHPQKLTTALRRQIQSTYTALPLAFEQNQGQTDDRVKYTARTSGYALFLTADDIVFSMQSSFRAPLVRERPLEQKALRLAGDPAHRQHDTRDSFAVIHMQLTGANAKANIGASDLLPGKANYFIGKDPGKWRSNIPMYARVSYENIYPGVNLAFHGEQRQLEFDFVVNPGASPQPITLHFTGAQKIKTDDSGDLLIASAAGDIMLHKPFAYQQLNGAKQAVDAHFVLKAGNRISFELGEYDHSRELVIDPSVAVLYASYLGGSGADEAEAITVDSSTGNAYVTGQTASADFPGASSTNKLTGAANVFVTEMNSTGSNFLFSTYVGGSGTDSGYGIALDKSGDVFVAGGTNSTDFPTTSGAFQTSLGSGAASNAFIFELNTTGVLTYGTYFGGTGSDVAVGMAFDQATGVYAVVGSASSTDFPVKNALQGKLAGASNGFVSLWSSGNALTFSTYLGAASGDTVNAVALDSSDNVYVTGKTSGPSFPTTTGAFQTKCGSDGTCNGGLPDAFVTEINSAGSKYVFSTFLGGMSNDLGDGIAVDATGVYVTGQTESNDFPIVTGGFQPTFTGINDAFVTKLNLTGSQEMYSSYLGGSAAQIGASIAVDSGGSAYITGQTDSSDFPLMNATQSTLGGGNDAFVTEVNPSGTKLLFSTYLGGSQDEDDGGNYGAIAVDPYGAGIYVAGNTASGTTPGAFPVFPNPGAYQTAYGGGSTDAFVAKYTQQSFGISATSPNAVSPGNSATSTITLTALNGYDSPVNLTCTVTGSGSPLPTCSASSFSTNPLTPTAGGATTTLTITVPSSSSALLAGRKFNYAAWLPIIGLSVIGLIWSFSDSERRYSIAFPMITIAGLLLIPACGGNSSVSGSILCTSAPSAPTGLAASSTNSTSTTLNWTAAAVGANCSVTGYTVYENGKSIATPSATTFNVTGLTAGSTYSFTVAASDSAGISAQSSAISVTTASSGTPAGTYTVTISGVGTDANATTQTASTTLTVN